MNASERRSAAKLTRQIGRPVIAIVVIGIVGLALLTWLAARGRDADARLDSWRAAGWALSVAEARLANLTGDYAHSDETFHHLHSSVDEARRQAEIADPLHRIHDIEHVLVFDSNNSLAFASHSMDFSGHERLDDSAMLATALGPLLEAARAAASTRFGQPAVPMPVLFAGQVHLAAAAVIVPSTLPSQTAAKDSYVFVLVRDFSPTLLSRFAAEEALPDLRASVIDDAGSGEMAMPLTYGDPPTTVGYLIWRPNLPGTELLRDLAAPHAIEFGLLLALLILVLRRARRAGSTLDAASAAVERSRGSLEAQVEKRTAELRAAEERYRGIVENALEGIFQFTPDGRFIGANPAMARILGYDDAGRLVAEASVGVMLSGTRRQAFERAIGEFGEVVDFVSEVYRRDGSKTWISQNTRAVTSADGSLAYYEGMAVDVTARREAEEKLIESAFHDALTGLPNRSLFFERLSQLVARGERSPDFVFAVLFLDCDRFKLINDSFGHLAGDNLLITLAQRLSLCLRPADTLARLGGDEFAILIEGGTMPNSAVALAARLHEACQEPMTLNGRELFVSLSIGVAWARSGDAVDAEAILRDADIAMYRAKDAGRNTTVLFEPGMHQAVVSRLEVETQLRHALERGEFVVHYQPVVSLTNQRIAGFEALVRWSHPTRGLIPPSDFIPTAEETGMIVPIGDWVLQEACAFAASWRRRYGAAAGELFVSVNVAAAQLEQADAVERVARALALAGLPGANLKLEITESMMMANPLEIHRTLNDIAALGVRLCVDDFGTGYSSLSHLHTFPVSTLKIDRAFTGRLTAGREHVEMARTILLLGQNLGLSVIAEGVETAMQCDWLRAAGCSHAQGYLFGAPVDYRATVTLLAEELANGAIAS